MSVWDWCFSCGEPAAKVMFWSATYPSITDQRFIRVSNPSACGPVDPPPPVDVTPPADPDIRVLLLKLIALMEEMRANQTKQTDQISKGLEELRVEVSKGIKIRW